MSENFKLYRASYYRCASLAIAGALLTVGVPLSWLTGRIRMDKPTPWLVWLAGIAVFAFFLACARASWRRSEEERWRSGE